MAGWDDPAGRIRDLEAEVHKLRAAVTGVLALCDEWDRLSKGETPTTSRIREAVHP